MSEVLLVEDSPVQREMISGILKDNGWKVTIACDGVEALEQLKTFNPDLVVLDIVMPRMNGYEVCRWIKSNPGTKNVPVVMCSSKGEEFDRYSRFNSWGSARETFDWSELCRVRIPLPPPEVQQAIVDIYNCAEEAKKIANEAREKMKYLCSALVQRAING